MEENSFEDTRFSIFSKKYFVYNKKVGLSACDAIIGTAALYF